MGPHPRLQAVNPPGRPGHLARVAATVLALCLAACSFGDGDGRDPVRIAVAEGVEQQVVAALISAALEDEGIPTVLLVEPGDTLDARDAVRSGRADVYIDYTGSAWTRSLGRSQPLARPSDSFEAVQAADEANALEWFGPTRANATLALFVRAADRPADEAGTMTWLAGRLANAPAGLCAQQDFLERPSGLPALAKTYAISTELLPTHPLGEAEALAAVAAGECFAGLGTATAGAAAELGLEAVIDDQLVFPAFLVSPVALAGGRADQAQVRAVVEPVMQTLTTEVLRELNALVDAGADPSDAARAHLDA